MKAFKSPTFGLWFFVKVYLALASMGARHVPKVKGLFYRLYSSIPNKKGIIRIKTEVGTAMYIDLADTIISTKLLEYGYWEKGLTDIVQKLVKPGMRVIDVGAHSGYYTLLFSKLVTKEGSVTAFEPDEHNYKLLTVNMEACDAGNCTAVPKAISNMSGMLPLYRDPENLGAHSLISYGENKVDSSVQVTTLDQYLSEADKTVDFIKMDIEGNEALALEGAARILHKNPNVILVVEFNSYIFEKINRNPEEFIRTLQRIGFRLFIVPFDIGPIQEIHSLASIPTGIVVNLLCLKTPDVLGHNGVEVKMA